MACGIVSVATPTRKRMPMDTLRDDDKTGEALKAQRFQMLEDIARELSSDLVFPTHFDASVRLRDVLRAPNAPVPRVEAAIRVEPLVCSRLISLANSSLYNRGGPPVRDVRQAILKLGMEVVRTTALAVAMKQLMQARSIADFSDMTKRLWAHSLMSAAASAAIARKFGRFNPDEAMLAGLVHDLGASYMLYRAAQYDELRARPETTRHLVMQWHESIGVSLLHALGLPEDIVVACQDHDQPRPVPEHPRTLGDVVYIANLMAGGHFEWLRMDFAAADAKRAELGPVYIELIEEAKREVAALQATLG